MARASREKVDGLIGVALEAFARSGLEGARVDAIASAAGMNKRLLYHYVGDKTALFDAAARAAVDRLLTTDNPGNDVPAWRVLCHASAAGRCPDLSTLVERLRAGSPAIAMQMLAGLLPEIAAALPQTLPPETRDHDDGPKSGAGGPGSARSIAGDRPKPRIKLRPGLSPGGSRG